MLFGWLFQPLLPAQEAPAAPVPLTALPAQKSAESDNFKYSLFADQSPEGAPEPLGNFEAAAAAAKGYLSLKKEAPLTLGNRTYTHGLIALHGSVGWIYALDGKYTGLSAEAGLMDTGGASLRVFGDGKLLHDTGCLPNQKAVPLLVDLRGVKELKLVVSDTGIKDWLKTFDSLSSDPIGLTTDNLGKGMGKLEEYATWDRLGIKAKIDQGWDVVIIQPWTEAYDTKVSDEDLLKHATTLVNWVRASGAYPVIYEPQFDWIFFKRYQARAHERLVKIAEALDTGYIPAGQGWLIVEKDYPQPVRADSPDGQGTTNDDPKALNKVMFADSVHQSYSGALFNSLMVWKYLAGRSPKDLAIPEAKNSAIGEDAVNRVRWDLVPYLQGKADEVITPAKDKLR
jgi:hypothetical protein